LGVFTTGNRKIMKNVVAIFLAVCMAFTGIQIKAQACKDYFPQKEGTILKYVSYDKKDKVTGSSEMSFKDKKETADGMSVIFVSKFSDDKEEFLFENEVKVTCRDGVLYFDASKFLDPATMSAYESMDVEVTADNLELPLDGAAGRSLADGSVTAVVRSGGVKIITVSVHISNRKIVAREKVETPAGSFECIKYTYDALSQIGFVKVRMSATEWYSAEYGSVRSESFNKNGKLTGYTVLESVR
jgi:hypothetical protein